MLANAVYFICGMIISALLCFIVHFIVETNKEKLEEADPFVHVLERKIYWLSNINLAFNKIKKIFDDGGSAGTLMTGSGPTVFAFFEDADRAGEAVKAVRSAGLSSVSESFVTTLKKLY